MRWFTEVVGTGGWPRTVRSECHVVCSSRYQRDRMGQPAGRRGGVVGDVVDEEVAPRRWRLGIPGNGRDVGNSDVGNGGVEVEEGAEQKHSGDPVGHRVVHLHVEADAVAVEAGEQPHLPERARAVEGADA